MRIDLIQLEFITSTLRDIAIAIERHFGVEFMVVSIYRIGDTGVHGTLPVRGLDLRCRDKGLGLAVQSYVNSRWAYDPKRSWKVCARYHDAGEGYHIHLQVHPATIKI